MWFQAKTLEFALAEFKENPTDVDVQNRFLSLLRQNFQRLLHPMENQPVSSNQKFGQDKIGQQVEVGNGQKIVLTAEIYQDALSMQEHFKLDFVVALDLILCGESQKKQYNDISRGLCAVLCYYDAHRSFLCTTRSLLSLIEDGVCPEYLSPEFQKFVNDIYNNNDFFDNCLKAFEILEKRTDFDRIYQFGFLRIVDDIEAEIYEVVCLLSLNCPASQQKIRLPALFKSAKQMDFDPKGLTDSFKAGIRKSVRLPELTVWTGITLFVSPAKIRAADSSCDEIFEIFEQNLKEHWAHLPLKASIQFFYAIAVKCTVGTFSRRDRLNVQDPIDQAIDHRCLHFIQQRLFQVPNIYRYNSSIEVIDKCIKDFIVYCPERVQQMFSICEEEVIIMDDPDLHKFHDLRDFPLNFKVLLNIIREIYEGDTDLLRNLSQQFFDPNFQLSNFIICGVSISASTLYVDYVYMLKALCKSRQAAQFICEHFSQGGESLFDWANLFGTLRQYVNEFHRSAMTYTNPHITMPAFQPLSHAIRMNSEELSGMVCWIRLATKIAELEPRSRRYFVLDNHFNAVETIILGVMTRFPLILKGHLYKFLAVLAKDEGSTVQLWTQLKLHGVCDYNEQARKLVGIQNELEEVESGENSYDSTEGFLHLVKSLFSRKNLTQTDLKTIAPYVQFTIKSVLCQYDQRGYKNKLQMWNMVSTALDALFELLRRFHISSVSVARKGPQVFVLSQLLNDSDLSRAIIRIIYECSNTLEETIAILSRDDKSPQYLLAEARNDAALSALRLLSHACAVSQTVRAAFRMAADNSPIFIAPLESILLTPLPTSPAVNYVHILNSFIEQQDSMLKHTFYVIRILSELCEQPSAAANTALLETFISTSRLVPVFARLISITGNEIIVDDNDLVPFDLEDVTEPRLRGEIARELLNIYTKVLIAHPSECSFVHWLFGFNLKNIEESDMSVIGAEGAALNSTVSLVEILEHLAFSPKPESASFVILYESALRVLLKLAAVGSISSIPMLSFLRNGCDNLIRRLAKSKIFLEVQNETLIHLEEPIFNSTAISLDHTTPRLNKVIDQDMVIESLKRLARGLILELIAVDFSVAMNLGHTDTGREYLEILLSNKDSDQAEHGLVWSLILNSISASLEIHTPRYNKFDMRKVDDVLDLCLRRSPISVDQYDVEYVKFLLEQELAAIVNDDVSDFQDDANQIVLYCVQYNAQRRLEGSCVQLLSGWIALVNAVLYFSPLPFIPIETQQQFCTDALTLLKEYVQKVEMNEEVLGGVSNCCFILVRELVKFTTVQYDSEMDRKLALGDVLNMLVSCAVFPTYNRHSQFKMNIYSSILCVIQSCTEETFKNDKKLVDQWHATGRFLNEPTESQGDKQTSLIGLINEKSRVDEIWVAVFEEHSAALVQSTAGDIEFAPFRHKVLAISTLSEMLKEDRFGKNSIANHVIRLGVVKTLLDLLPRITDLDFKSGNATTNRDNLTLFHVILCFLIRLTNSTTGFKTLAECDALHRIAKLTLWQNPPRDVFFLPVNGESENKNGTPQMYLKCVRSLFRLCEAAASTIYKNSALDGIEQCVSVQTELLNHLKRQCDNEKDHPLVKTALLLLEFVHNLKESYGQVATTN